MRADLELLRRTTSELSDAHGELLRTAREVHRIDGWTPWASDRDALWALLWPGEAGTASVDSRSLPPEVVRPQETSEAHEAHDAECERLRLELRAAQRETEEARPVLEAAERWERAREAALRACRRWDEGGRALPSRVGRELEAAAEALAAAVRARRAGR